MEIVGLIIIDLKGELGAFGFECVLEVCRYLILVGGLEGGF